MAKHVLGTNVSTVGDLRSSLKDVPDHVFVNIGNSEVGFSVDAIHCDGLSVALETNEPGMFVAPISAKKIELAKNCLVDNGIEVDEVETVLQELGYILLDGELFPVAPGRPSRLKRQNNIVRVHLNAEPEVVDVLIPESIDINDEFAVDDFLESFLEPPFDYWEVLL